MSDKLEKIAELFDVAKGLVTDKNVLKATLTLQMMIKAAGFVSEAWKDFETDNPSTEAQLALYDKYDQFYMEAKQEMKTRIAEARAAV